MILVRSMHDQIKDCREGCSCTEIMSCSTEETNEKIESKQEKDTSSNGNNIRKGIQLTRSYFWQYGKTIARKGINLLNITLKKG